MKASSSSLPEDVENAGVVIVTLGDRRSLKTVTSIEIAADAGRAKSAARAATSSIREHCLRGGRLFLVVDNR